MIEGPTVTRLQKRIGALEAALASSEQIRTAEKAILIKEIEDHTTTKADLAAAKAEIERLVRALDEEMVSCGIGTFELGNDPKKAVNSLMFWSQGVGEYFAGEKAKEYHAANMRLIEERDTLRAQLEQMRTRAEDAERAKYGTPCKCESWQNVCEAAENKCDQLKQQLEQMGRPATDDERDETYSEGHSPDRYQRLLAARAAKAKEQP